MNFVKELLHSSEESVAVLVFFCLTSLSFFLGKSVSILSDDVSTLAKLPSCSCVDELVFNPVYMQHN